MVLNRIDILFLGHGNRLGSIVPMESSQPPPEPVVSAPVMSIDNTLPVTSIQIRLGGKINLFIIRWN